LANYYQAINKKEGVALVVVTHSINLANSIGNKYILSGGKISLRLKKTS